MNKSKKNHQLDAWYWSGVPQGSILGPLLLYIELGGLTWLVSVIWNKYKRRYLYRFVTGEGKISKSPFVSLRATPDPHNILCVTRSPHDELQWTWWWRLIVAARLFLTKRGFQRKDFGRDIYRCCCQKCGSWSSRKWLGPQRSRPVSLQMRCSGHVGWIWACKCLWVRAESVQIQVDVTIWVL